MNVTDELLEQEFDETTEDVNDDLTEEEEDEDGGDESGSASDDTPNSPQPAQTDPAILDLIRELAGKNASQTKPESEADIPEDVMYDPKKLNAYVSEAIRSQVDAVRREMAQELEAIKKPALVTQIAATHGIAPEAAAHLADGLSSSDLTYLSKSPGFAKFVSAMKGKANAKPATKVPTQTPKSTKPAPKGPQLDDMDKEVLATYEKRFGKDSKEYKERRAMLLGGKA